MVPRPMRIASVIAAAALVLVACSNNNNGGASGGGGGGGNTVSMLVVFGGDELKNFESALKPFEDANNIDVKIESNRDANAILQTRIDGGNPPDVAGLPGPGPMAQWTRDGDLKEMPQDVKDTLSSDYSDTYTAAGSVDGKLVGIFAKVSLKGLIWYNPKAFSAAGYEVPTDDASFQALVDKIANDGTPPWGIGLESGAATGWPATDWIEDFMVRQSGPDKYDEWWQGKLKFSSPEVKAAFEAFGKWATSDKYTFGGPNKELTLAFGNSGDCMFADKPTCYLVHQGSFMSGFFETNFPNVAKAGETYDYFMMPGQQFNAITNSGDVFGMFNDTDAAKKLMAYLVSKDFQEAWVKTGGVLSANKNVSPDTYPDETGKRAAQDLANAQIIRYDASDLMPSSLNDAFFKAVGQYLQNPDQLDTILKGLDDAQAQAYQQ
jgi:alpha-glucoside transport system substrate-binding protein